MKRLIAVVVLFGLMSVSHADGSPSTLIRNGITNAATVDGEVTFVQKPKLAGSKDARPNLVIRGDAAAALFDSILEDGARTVTGKNSVGLSVRRNSKTGENLKCYHEEMMGGLIDNGFTCLIYFSNLSNGQLDSFVAPEVSQKK